MARLVPLLAPVVLGLLAITRILYPVPVTVPAGIVAVIVPEGSTPEADKVPIVVPGKPPDAFDNCAVKTLPALKVPTLVKGTETDAPVEAVTQNGLPIIVPVEIVAGTAVTAPEREIFLTKSAVGAL